MIIKRVMIEYDPMIGIETKKVRVTYESGAYRIYSSIPNTVKTYLRQAHIVKDVTRKPNNKLTRYITWTL